MIRFYAEHCGRAEEEVERILSMDDPEIVHTIYEIAKAAAAKPDADQPGGKHRRGPIRRRGATVVRPHDRIRGAKSAIEDRDFTIATIVAPTVMRATEDETAAEAAPTEQPEA